SRTTPAPRERSKSPARQSKTDARRQAPPELSAWLRGSRGTGQYECAETEPALPPAPIELAGNQSMGCLAVKPALVRTGLQKSGKDTETLLRGVTFGTFGWLLVYFSEGVLCVLKRNQTSPRLVLADRLSNSGLLTSGTARTMLRPLTSGSDRKTLLKEGKY